VEDRLDGDKFELLAKAQALPPQGSVHSVHYAAGAWQARWLDGFHGHAAGQFALRGANGTGKSGLIGPLLIYVALALKGTAVYFSASERQTRQQMKTLLERLVARIEGIDATVYLHGVKFAGAGVVALSTAGEADSMQGSHRETLLIVADEAQALDSEQLQALQGCVVADDNWLVLSGNPLGVGTAFHRISTTADPSWQRTKVTAVEVVEDPEPAHIRGLVTKKGVDNLRQTWGEQSVVFQSRVMAEFPSQPADAMFPEVAIQAAFARWHDPDFRASQRAEGLSLGVDVGASTDGDPSALAVAWGGFVSELTIWFEQDTMKSVGRVVAEFRRLRVAKIRGSAFEEREASILADRIGAMFAEAAQTWATPRTTTASTRRSSSTRSASARAWATGCARRSTPAPRSPPRAGPPTSRPGRMTTV
jgi:hypothetical protein